MWTRWRMRFTAVTDVIDILKEMMKNDKPEQENETEAEKEE